MRTIARRPGGGFLGRAEVMGHALLAALSMTVAVAQPLPATPPEEVEEPEFSLPGPLVAPVIVPPWEEPWLAPRSGPTITFEERVLEIVNLERLANGGQPPLKGVAELDTSSGTHSFNMADRDFFAHCDLDTGSTQGSRMTAAGYSWHAAAENIAAGYPTPEAVMAGWMGSTGHRNNILSTGFREIGVGFFNQANDQQTVRMDEIGNCVADTFNQGPFFRYWTQNFGRRNSVFPLVINREAHDTVCADLSLYVYGPGNAVDMRFSNDGSSWSAFEPYSPHKTWPISGSSGSPATVFSEVTDGTNTFAASDSIFLGSGFPATSTLIVPDQTVSSTQTFEACHTVSATSGFTVTATGDVTFRAGQRVVLGDGFSIASGGSFRAVIDPNL